MRSMQPCCLNVSGDLSTRTESAFSLCASRNKRGQRAAGSLLLVRFFPGARWCRLSFFLPCADEDIFADERLQRAWNKKRPRQGPIGLCAM